MRFRFVPAKRAANLKKHGLGLADARHVIESEQAIYRENLT